MRWLALLLLLAAGWLAPTFGCATPVAPSGGPADTTPPALVASLPASGATRVADRTVRLTFSERLDATSAARAVTVTPAADAPPQVRVDGREVVVVLPPLRDATTYVLTLGTDLADARRVRLAAPIVVAFSTGDRIDAGQIAGVVRDPQRGRPVAGRAVWAYAAGPDSTARPDPSAAAPDYRTVTGADGRYRFQYLREGAYAVLAVSDADRDRRVGRGEALAPPRAAVRADSAGATLDLWAGRPDPLAIRSVRPLSDRRLLVRFSQGVQVRPSARASAAVVDTAGATVGTLDLYASPERADEMIAWGRTPLRPGPAHLSASGVADSTGLGLPADARSAAFEIPARADTARTRFVRFEPRVAHPDSAVTLPHGVAPRVRLSGPSDAPVTILATTGGAPDARVDTLRVTGTDVAVRAPGPADALAEAWPLVLTVVTPDTTARARFAAPDPGTTGGIVLGVPPGSAWQAEALPASGPPVRATARDGRLAVDGLAPGDYGLRLWLDADGDGAWSPGAVAPYAAPEPLVVLDAPVTVRARWDTEVEPARLALPDAP